MHIFQRDELGETKQKAANRGLDLLIHDLSTSLEQ